MASVDARLARLPHQVAGLRAAARLSNDAHRLGPAVGQDAAQLAALAPHALRLYRAACGAAGAPRGEDGVELALEGERGTLAFLGVSAGTLCLLLAPGVSVGRARWEVRRALRSEG